MAKDPYGFGTKIEDIALKDLYNNLLKYVEGNESNIREWVSDRPTIDRTYEGLVGDIQNRNLRLNPVPEHLWDAYQKKNWKGDKTALPEGPGGWYDSDDSIHFPDTEYGRTEALPHEVMHYFASHGAGQRGTPEEINPYIKADIKAKGWLPSFHPSGRRPTLPKWMPGNKWWNENMRTKQAEYSNERKYHPWFDEDAFDAFEDDHRTLEDQIFKDE